MWGQEVPAITGVPDDWGHHHLVFSNPGTERDAIWNGTHEQWLKVVNDPRFQIQQLKRSRRQPPPLRWRLPESGAIKTDWSMNLGSGATVGVGQYPAKYSFSTSTPTAAQCGTGATPDFVVYNTGLAGVSGGQANIVAYDNLYTTCGGTVPTVYWSYYSGAGKALTSPVISLDGTKIAYIENTSSGAILRIIKWVAAQGTPSASATPTKSYTNTTAGAGGNTTWNTTNCPTGDSCLISVAFQNSKLDTISAPFYVYNNNVDILYVGDASGNLHQFSGVFGGAPGEVTTGGWPIAVSTNVLTGPVYDPTSGNIFVADSGGHLYSYKASNATHEMTSSKLTYASGTVGIVDGPVVDSTAEEVYVFVGDDANTTTSFGCDVATGCSGVFQFSASNTTQAGSLACAATSTTAWPTNSNCGVESVFGVGTTTTPTIYDGTFDQIYYAGTGTTGNLWACSGNASSEPRLSYVPLASGFSNAAVNVASTAIASLTSGTATCSPVTEIYGSNNSTDDYIYLSVTALGTQTGCSGACLYNFVVSTNGTSTTAPTSATAGIASAGGSSGIIIDNRGPTSSGESQIYFTPLANQTCTTSGGTGGCAIQALQTAP